MSKKKKSSDPVLSFDVTSTNWPSQQRFPINLTEDINVERILIQDIKESEEYLIVTGFTSLSHLVIFFGEKVDINLLKEVRIVLGWSPDEKFKKDYSFKIDIDKEIKEYWIKEGFSILDHAGAVMNLIDIINNKKIFFRASNKKGNHLHAKIYVGRYHAVIGSANFSINGLNKQQEANVRFKNNLKMKYERSLYEDTWQLANNFYENGRDFNDQIKSLLKKTLSLTTWQEALARAIHEVLNRNWIDDFSDLKNIIELAKLWPIQKKAIGWSLSILQEQGCVLVAMPTGSGKTKLITILQLILIKWTSDVVGIHKAKSQVVCPPIVVSKWDNEKASVMSTNDSISTGILSLENSSYFDTVIKQIEAANILVIDEVHNFLRPAAKRTQNLSRNKADNIIIATATPISRKSQDLLRLVEILGLDNLDDNLMSEYKFLLKRGSLKNINDFSNLKNFIGNFIVRKTKREINIQIDEEPNKYLNKLGNECRYPKKDYDIYETEESEADKLILKEIENLMSGERDGLLGVIYLQKFLKLDLFPEISPQQYINNRLNAAKFLAQYNIQYALRSSKAALIERIEGTEAALKHFNILLGKNETGDIVSSIQSIINTYKLPLKEFDDSLFPDWLIDIEKYVVACNKEIIIYKKIVELCKKISDNREIGKAKFLIKLFERHKLVIAFDDTIITLKYLHKIIEELNVNIEVHIGAGDTDVKPIINKFHLGSEANKVLALCSRSMSEGIDLQQSDVLVMLDIPSVLRYMDQRIGRIDRLDSPHKSIKIYFPNDSDEFSLKTDLKLYKTVEEARYLIGNDMQWPDQLVQKFENKLNKLNIKDLMNLVQDSEAEEDHDWAEFSDAYSDIEKLFLGKDALISEEIYKSYKDLSVEVKVKISIEYSNTNWAFVVVKGSKLNPPKWFFIDSDQIPISDFTIICTKLKDKLNNIVAHENKWNKGVDSELKKYSRILRKYERDLLPRKRKKSLEVAEFILNEMFKKSKNNSFKLLLVEIINIFKINSKDITINYYLFSQQWLDIFNEPLFELRKKRTRKNFIVNLETLKTDFSNVEAILTYEKLTEIRDNAPFTESIWKNIAACIIGVKYIPNATIVDN